MKACRLAAEKQDMAASRTRPGPPSRTSTAPATSILPSALRPCPPSGGSALLRCGIAVSSISTRPASGERSGATMARRSLPHKSQADLYEPRPSCFCSCSAAMPSEWVVIPEPGRQRQLRCMHHRAGGHRGLLAAKGALPGEGLGRQFPALVVAAVRAAEPVGPAGFGQIRRARLLVREAALELDERAGKIGHGEPSIQDVRHMFYLSHPPQSPHFVPPELRG